MNNGRFWTIMDLGRYDLAARAGLMRVAHRQGWFFVVAGGSIRYRRRLPLSAASSSGPLAGHDGRWFYFVQEFVRGGKVAAQAVVRAGLRTDKAMVPSKTVLGAVGREDWAPLSRTGSAPGSQPKKPGRRSDRPGPKSPK
ncbi:MAG: acyl-CoA thioesterase [Comamonadaceae bacterium]|nr:acyl-CoA thioesterase [Comamonadaceae bacterium]